MKIRSIVLLAVGIGIGYTLSQKLHEDDPDVVTGPQRAEPVGLTANPAVRAATDQAQRLAEAATVWSLDAIRRTRGAIRDRLGDDDQDAAWN